LGNKAKNGEGDRPPLNKSGGKQDFQVKRWKSAQSCSVAKDGDTPVLPLAVALWGKGLRPLKSPVLKETKCRACAAQYMI